MDIHEIRATRRRVGFLSEHVNFSDDNFLEKCSHQGIIPQATAQLIRDAKTNRERADIFITEVCKPGPSHTMFNRMCFLFDKADLWEVAEELQAEVAFERGQLPAPDIDPAELAIWIRNALKPKEQLSQRTVERLSQVLLDRIAVKLEVHRRSFRRAQKIMHGHRIGIQSELSAIDRIMDELLNRLSTPQPTTTPSGHALESALSGSGTKLQVQTPSGTDIKAGEGTSKGMSLTVKKSKEILSKSANALGVTDPASAKSSGSKLDLPATSGQAASSPALSVNKSPGISPRTSQTSTTKVLTINELKAKVDKVVTVIETNYKNQEAFLKEKDKCFDMLALSEEERNTATLDKILEQKLSSTSGKLEQLQDDAIKRFQMAYTLKKQMDDITEEYEEILEGKEQELENVKKQSESKDEALERLKMTVVQHNLVIPEMEGEEEESEDSLESILQQASSSGTNPPPGDAALSKTSSKGSLKDPGSSAGTPGRRPSRPEDMPPVRVSFDGSRRSSVIQQVAKVDHPQWNASTKTKK